MRTDAGKGPLELLALRGFAMPPRIFVTGSPAGIQKQAMSGPPPLPAAMLESAKHAEVPLPSGLPGRSTSAAVVSDTPTRQTVDASAAGIASSAKKTPAAPVE